MFNLGPLELLCPLVTSMLTLAAFALWVYALVDLLRHEPSDDNPDRMTWLLVTVFLFALGGALYLLIRRPQRQAKYGR